MIRELCKHYFTFVSKTRKKLSKSNVKASFLFAFLYLLHIFRLPQSKIIVVHFSHFIGKPETRAKALRNKGDKS